jgi:hypothetical protein
MWNIYIGVKYFIYYVILEDYTDETAPQTDTGELVQYTKAIERTMLKELGKMAL